MSDKEIVMVTRLCVWIGRNTSLCRAMASLLIAAAACSVAHAEDLSQCMHAQEADRSQSYALAIELYRSCLKTGQLSDWSAARTYRNIGITYRHAKAYSRAIEAFNLSLSLHPDDPWSDYINRGNSYDDSGQFAKAMADYNTALKLYPGYGEIYYNRGITYEHQKLYKQAAHEFYQAYQHGLRSDLLYDRLIVYKMLKPDE
jgi:tetratricopeptide (TPR) repeat protein